MSNNKLSIDWDLGITLSSSSSSSSSGGGCVSMDPVCILHPEIPEGEQPVRDDVEQKNRTSVRN